MNALQKLEERTNKGFHICVGLDSDLERIPKFLLGEKNPILSFNERIIEATLDYAAAYKLNFAFYESQGLLGYEALRRTVEILPKDILIIADAKRGDIGNTSAQYAKAIFEELNFDAVTLNPLMGFDSIAPFVEYEERLSFILGLTSNPSSKDFEKLLLADGKFLFQKILLKIGEWNRNNNLGVVFGATNLQELQSNFELLKDLPVLLPGVGAQGGSVEDVKRLFYQNEKRNFIINVSRSLIFAEGGKNFQQAVRQKIEEYNKVFQ